MNDVSGANGVEFPIIDDQVSLPVYVFGNAYQFSTIRVDSPDSLAQCAGKLAELVSG
jgi:hypothetical protein